MEEGEMMMDWLEKIEYELKDGIEGERKKVMRERMKRLVD